MAHSCNIVPLCLDCKAVAYQERTVPSSQEVSSEYGKEKNLGLSKMEWSGLYSFEMHKALVDEKHQLLLHQDFYQKPPF